MKIVTRAAVLLTALGVVLLGVVIGLRGEAGFSGPALSYTPATRSPLDHGAFFDTPFASGPEVTRACLSCHPDAAAQVMSNAHWTWLKTPGAPAEPKQAAPLGKRNAINNFCLGIAGNWPSCTKCHAGYGWEDDRFDFSAREQVDCLVCHDRSGQYIKGTAGQPLEGVDLLAAARSVSFPSRENCGTCHSYGGGGMGVKHGDLDNSLDNPSSDLDVHMGRHGMLCIDCHRTHKHDIPGVSFAVSVDHSRGIGCTQCHTGRQHRDERIEAHLGALACQTCHIPAFARREATKMAWDWSKAGDDSRPDDFHEYLKIKGEFVYDTDVRPEYAWFNLTVDRYRVGDVFDPNATLSLNQPRGDIRDPEAKIWPFKVHRGVQPYDLEHRYLLLPVTAGEGGYWREFDWDQAFRLGEKTSGLAYSGAYGWARTSMYWPLSHMVAPADRALGCAECHGPNGRMDFSALGYAGDPAIVGGRR